MPFSTRDLIRDIQRKDKNMSDILDLRKEDAPRFVALAARCLEQNDLEGAQAAAEAAVACDGESADAIATLGSALARRDEFTRAAACFELAVKKRPNDVVLWTNLGECYLFALRYKQAADALRKAMQLDPNSEHAAGRRARAVAARTLIKLKKERG
jgi:cytochrome c-type biogenesis protein CcmH/NrfG